MAPWASATVGCFLVWLRVVVFSVVVLEELKSANGLCPGLAGQEEEGKKGNDQREWELQEDESPRLEWLAKYPVDCVRLTLRKILDQLEIVNY